MKKSKLNKASGAAAAGAGVLSESGILGILTGAGDVLTNVMDTITTAITGNTKIHGETLQNTMGTNAATITTISRKQQSNVGVYVVFGLLAVSLLVYFMYKNKNK